MSQLSTSQLVSILLPIAVVQLALMISAIAACVRSERTIGPKWLWLLIIVLSNMIGSVLFFLFGRKQS